MDGDDYNDDDDESTSLNNYVDVFIHQESLTKNWPSSNHSCA